MRVTCCQILASWSVRQRWEYIHHCDVCWNRIWSFWCFVLVWLLAYVSDFCFQTYFKNADGPWKAAINAVRQRNQANSTVPQPLLLGTAQPHSRKRVGFAPQEAAKQLFSWWVMANSGSWVIFQSSEGWDSYMEMQHACYNGSLDAFFFCITGSLWTVGISAQLTHCCLFVSFLQKWNTQLIVPASSANAQNLVVGGKMSRADSYSANESFPVEQLRTFPQLLQNIHRLEVSGRKVPASSLHALERTKDFCPCPCTCLVCGQPTSERASSPTWVWWAGGLGDDLSAKEGLDSSDSMRACGNL